MPIPKCPECPVKLGLAAALLFVAAVSVHAQYKPLYYSDMPKVSTPYDTVLQKTWEGIKARNVDAYATGLVHRPKSETPGDAVSEGVAYGMFLALYCNDQTYFDKIWDAGEKYMLNSAGDLYDWRVNQSGSNAGTGPASDADQDIALLLIFADKLVEKGIWKTHVSVKGADYKTRARALLTSIRTTMIDGGKYLKPGRWGSANHLNPGYFAPASYRVFAEFDPTNAAAWDALVEGSYEVIENSPGYGKGLLPDWCGWDGSYTGGGAGYNGYRGGIYQYRDAIRVYWRLATDYLWYGEPRAKAFLDKAAVFIEDLGGAEKANFFDMDGNLPPAADGEMLNGGTQPRTRREHSHLTLGMWAAAAMGSGGPTLAQSYSDLLLQKFYAKGRDFFGQINISAVTLESLIIVKDSDASETLTNVLFAEDTLRNEMYFDQFLAWFGASILGGRFTNVWEDLKGEVPAGPLDWKTRPPSPLPDWNINAEVKPLTFGASFNRSAQWTVTLTRDTTGEHVSFSGNSDTVNVIWYGLNETGGYMPRGFYTLTLSAGSLSYTTKVWLGKPYAGNFPNLLTERRLLVDDFADGDIYPYIGKVWQTFSDANSNGGNSGAVMNPAAASGNAGGRLEWDYTIRPGFEWAFAALEWNCRTSSGGVMDLTGVDSIIIVARSKTSAIGVSVQLIDTDDNSNYTFFEDSISLTTTSKTYGLRLSSTNFKQRLGGSDRNFSNTLSNMMALRFHIQYPVSAPQSSDAIIVEKIYLAGQNNVLSRFYTPPDAPPEYMPPPYDPIGVAYHADRNSAKYAIKRAGNNIRVTLPANMAGANAKIVDIRGRTVRRMGVPQGGSFDLSAKNLAAGMYFMEIKKQGRTPIKVQLGNLK